MHLELNRDAAKIFPEIDEAGSIETARVWHCNYRTLEPLRAFTNIRALDVATYPDESFEVLAGLEVTSLSVV